MADKKPTAPAQDVTKDWQASQSQKSSAGNFRLFAAIAWIIAIAGECYGVWLIYHRAFDQGGQPLLLGLLIGIAVFAIAGNLFWKAANRRDPARASDTARFFFQNQLGAIISVIAFLPLLVLIFTDKNMDPRTKQVGGSVGAVLLVLATVLGINFQPPSVEQYTQDMDKCAAEIKANQPTTDCSPEVAAQAQAIANDTSTIADATKDADHPNGQDVVYWIAPAAGQTKSDIEHVFHLCAEVSPLKDKTVHSGSVTQAYAENATRITQQIAMEQKQCGFTTSQATPSASSMASSG
ncbi:MAG: hypothetical protein BGO82_11425 [Devosia sp. 67-54]|uniref:hypothetical protein n=1 Tax=unclassified Devosia TaxID=196773 RepID=UPI00086E595C|nr:MULTISPECIES: hypothetical protein [unclassified Devosia]MBN9304749.1 hypothetical protein [Devosia sp.]ODU56468.1 MAG: hypothetical protein ABS99_05850 [Acetobacteraceae bacterium SCN 69-10]OJX15282.1 MAG: hypothetical protein BGO82_11425 [Devosia sp. 67-54]